MKAFREITDQEWGSVEPLLPECRPQSNRDPRGRPMKNRRACMNATLFVMFTGVSWQMLPRKYPSYQTCHRCFKAWYDAGVMHKVAAVLFGQESPDFLGLVAARVRIALRETRGGVDRAVKRTDTSVLKKSPLSKPAGAVPMALKRGAAATPSTRPMASASTPLSPPATAGEQARSKKRAKAMTVAGKLPRKSSAGVSVKSPAKPRAAESATAVSPVPVKRTKKTRHASVPTPAERATSATQASDAVGVQAKAKRIAPSKSAKPMHAVKAVTLSKPTRAVKPTTRGTAEVSSLPIVPKRTEKSTPKTSLKPAPKEAPKQAPKRASNRENGSRERGVAVRQETLRVMPVGAHAVGSRSLKVETEVRAGGARGKAAERRATKTVAL